MVGKLSDDTKMSGSRIPVIYGWKYGQPHPYSTPNDELRKSIQAKNGEYQPFDIGEPGAVGNLLEPVLIQSACDELGLPSPNLTPDVIKRIDYEVSCDGLVTLPEAREIFAGGIVEIRDLDKPGELLDSIKVSGVIPIECKCTSAHPDDDIPQYRGPIQLQAQMMASEAQFGILITLYRGIERRITIYPASATVQSRIESICSEFTDRVLDESYYPPVNIDDAVIRPAREKSECDIGDLEPDIDRLEELRVQRKELDDEIAELELAIMSKMDDAEVGITESYRVEWPVRHYKAQPEKTTPAKDARTIRLKTLKIKRIV